MNQMQLRPPGFGDDFETALRGFFSPTLLAVDRELLQMRIDVSEKADAYMVKADIPGAKKEDIQVRVDGNHVQIDAEVREEKEKRDSEKVLRSERYYGCISRSFSLAQDVDDARVQATYADGVLSLELPKKAAKGSKSITVQ